MCFQCLATNITNRRDFNSSRFINKHGSRIEGGRGDRRKQRCWFGHCALALNYPKSPLKSGPFLIYLTARSPERGQDAVRTLNQDDQLKKAKVLAEHGGDTTIKYHAFDVSDSQSIREFRDFLQKEHPEGIDVVINNAGKFIRWRPFDG